MTQGADTGGAPARIRIWDAPVRLFHWAIVALLGVLWWSGEERLFDWHRLAGYTLLRIQRRAPVPIENREAFQTLPADRAVTPEAVRLDPRVQNNDDNATVR